MTVEQMSSPTVPALRSVGLVTGLALEAALVPAKASPRLIPLCAGPGPAAAARASWRLMERGCSVLVSFGTAGGLDPALPPGTLIIPEEIRLIGDQPPLPVDSTLRRRLIAACELAGLPVHAGPLVGSDLPLLSPADKARVAQLSGAAAVDMESHRVAEIALDAGLPFLAVRVIADPADRSVPRWAMKGINEKGATVVAPILLALAVAPWRLPALITLARSAARARHTLGRVACGPLLDLLGR
ncbi:purine phosphorylase [Rhodospirillum rubrum]|uniref:phosphorylase family protein n=1 Tax=Rhodospirillum rubrum TaxID=1085 RepID=UPI0019069E14|nr:purine phosphorylase [Rhodospirillum rubrum]MBK1665422.1 purine phosphorylase [Rhodospirillum rubrum]MBK1677251.1 purine phosphorylase [Rhodospirillum rubrum]